MSNISSGDEEEDKKKAISILKELAGLCESNNLSLDVLQKKRITCVYRVCMNKKITLEIIEHLLDIFPDAARLSGGNEFGLVYPLHLCCYNENCPSEVIQLFIALYPDALTEYSLVEKGVKYVGYRCNDIRGLPLHYYLARDSNVDVGTVKMLVEAYPQALLADDNDMRLAPIYIAISNEQINIDNLHEITAYLLDVEPKSIRLRNISGQTLLSMTCKNKGTRLGLFQFIYEAWPEALQLRDDDGCLPIHCLCLNEELDYTNSLDILQFMLNIDPTLPREADGDGYLPLHWAVQCKSTAFCKLLINAYPQSLREEVEHNFPVHFACHNTRHDKVDTIQYMLDHYPESIHIMNDEGYMLIHIASTKGHTDIIEMLLRYDPNAATEESNINCRLPLHLACRYSPNLNSVQILYDAYPEAILARDVNGNTPLDLTRRRAELAGSNTTLIMNFLHIQFAYARQARDITLMTTVDENGWLPLHRALKDNASLGSIKLFMKANPAAVQVADRNGVFPLHIACEYNSAKVVNLLVEQTGDTAELFDTNKDSPLHYACRGGNLGVIKCLLERNVPSISGRNSDNKLAIHLLLECGESMVDKESTEYMETIWLLLSANPEVVKT